MQTIVAETTKPPAYPFIIHQCQRANITEQQTTELTQLSPGQLAVHPIMSDVRVTASANLPIRFFRRFRFGEAASSHPRKQPQEENFIRQSFFFSKRESFARLAFGEIFRMFSGHCGQRPNSAA